MELRRYVLVPSGRVLFQQVLGDVVGSGYGELPENAGGCCIIFDDTQRIPEDSQVG